MTDITMAETLVSIWWNFSNHHFAGGYCGVGQLKEDLQPSNGNTCLDGFDNLCHQVLDWASLVG